MVCLCHCCVRCKADPPSVSCQGGCTQAFSTYWKGSTVRISKCFIFLPPQRERGQTLPCIALIAMLHTGCWNVIIRDCFTWKIFHVWHEFSIKAVTGSKTFNGYRLEMKMMVLKGEFTGRFQLSLFPNSKVEMSGIPIEMISRTMV